MWIAHITVFKNCYLSVSVRDSLIDNSLWQMWAALKSRNLYLYCVSGEEGSMEWFLSIMADQCPCVDTIQTLWSGDRGHYATCHRATTLGFFKSDIGIVMNTQHTEKVSILIGTLVSRNHIFWRIFSDQTDPFWTIAPFTMVTSCLNDFFELCKFLTVSMIWQHWGTLQLTGRRPPPGVSWNRDWAIQTTDYWDMMHAVCSAPANTPPSFVFLYHLVAVLCVCPILN